jgi:c-di-GMP-binding flagellar brake protein YcgR
MIKALRSGSLDELNPNESELSLEVGHLVTLHPDGPAGGFPMDVRVDRITDGLHWFLGCCEPIGRGESMTVESPIHDDARYVTRATVEASSREMFALRLKPIWERVQQRAFVRVFAHGLQVRVLRPTSELGREIDSEDDPEIAEPHYAVHDLVDISAGGLRFASGDDYEPDEDEEVVCHFELPGSLCFVLPARIVFPSESRPTGSGKPSVAVEFVNLDENNRSQLLRWIYREQVQRHRDGLSQDPGD